MINYVASMTAIILVFATATHAQHSRFLFDPTGNLRVQSANVLIPPQITGQPQTQVVGPGATASFLVVANGSTPLAYQWQFNGANIGGAVGEVLLLENVSANNEGEYQLVLTNPSGSVTSTPAFLMLDDDHDGMGDSWELAHFTNLDRNAAGDFDGDGSTDLREFFDGTDPTDSNSFKCRLLAIRDAGEVITVPDKPSYTNGEIASLTAVPSANSPFHAWLGDIVTRSNPVTIVMTSDKTVHARFTPIAFTWTNVANGDWNDATNWTPNLAPASNDTAIITRTVTVTLSTLADCADFTLGTATTGPTLTGNGRLTVRGSFLWEGGTMSGSGRTVVEAGATLTIANPGGSALGTRTLENAGTVVWSSTGHNVVLGNCVITNRPGALFDVQNAATLVFASGNPRFDNAGTFRKSTSAGTLTVENGITFNNSGTVEIRVGTLRLGGGGLATGNFDTAVATAMECSSGTFTLSPGAQLNGAGLYKITLSTVTANTDLRVANLDLAGTLGGTGTVTISNIMNWTGGFMSGSGRTVIRPGAALNVANDVSGVGLSGRTLENGGTLLWTGAQSIGLDSGAVITNRAGALFEVRSAASFGTLFTGNRIDNAGTFRKSVNPGTTTVGSGATFNNSGTVDIRSGILAANGGYTSTAGALLNCTLGGTMAGPGHGKLQVSGAVTLNGALSVDLVNGFLPATNDVFTVLTAGERSGAFANFHFPSNEFTMQLSNTPNSVIVHVSATVIPELVLFPPVLTSSNVMLCWTAQSNKAYVLEYVPELGLTNWSAVAGDVITSSNKACKVDALTSSNRFYRVRLLP